MKFDLNSLGGGGEGIYCCGWASQWTSMCLYYWQFC